MYLCIVFVVVVVEIEILFLFSPVFILFQFYTDREIALRKPNGNFFSLSLSLSFVLNQQIVMPHSIICTALDRIHNLRAHVRLVQVWMNFCTWWVLCTRRHTVAIPYHPLSECKGATATKPTTNRTKHHAQYCTNIQCINWAAIPYSKLWSMRSHNSLVAVRHFSFSHFIFDSLSPMDKIFCYSICSCHLLLLLLMKMPNIK